MTNVPFDDIDSFRDIESLNYYTNATTRFGLDPSTVLATLRAKSRDNARTPMHWDPSPGAGFSTGSPWIPVNPNHIWLNAEAQKAAPRSIYHYYRQLIALRRAEPVVTFGDFQLIPDAPETVYSFRRCLGEHCMEVHANLSDTTVPLAGLATDPGRMLLGNYPEGDREPARLAPWEVRAYWR
jgi:oligo-1,6-glucosidase